MTNIAPAAAALPANAQVQGLLAGVQGAMANPTVAAALAANPALAAQTNAVLAQAGAAPAAGVAVAPAAGAGTATAVAGGGGIAATGGGVLPIMAGLTQAGRQVTLTPDANGQYTITPPTGSPEAISVNGKLLRYDGAGKLTRLFSIAEKTVVRVNLENKEGIATGINNLSRLVAARQERGKMLTDALASDANDNGTLNQIDLQLLVQENQTNENITGLQKKIYDSVQASVQAWLR